MKKPPRKRTAKPPQVAEDEILPEYHFSHARRNPYANRIARDSVIVVLEPDVARVFPDAASVNEALRALARVAERTSRKSRSKRHSA